MRSILFIDPSDGHSPFPIDRIQGFPDSDVVSVSDLAESERLLREKRAGFFLAIVVLGAADGSADPFIGLFHDHDLPSVLLTETDWSDSGDDLSKKGVLARWRRDDPQTIPALRHLLERFWKNGAIRVLVVDGSKERSSASVRLFRRFGFAAVERVDPGQALRRGDDGKPRLIVVTLSPLDGDAPGFIRNLRNRFSREMAAIIVLVPEGDSNAAMSLVESGADDFLTGSRSDDALMFRCRQQVERLERNRTVEWFESRHRLVMDNALDAIITTDGDGRVQEYNPAAEALFGYSLPDIIGGHIADFIVPDSHEEPFREALAHYSAMGATPSGVRQRIEIPGLKADGRIIDLEVALAAHKRSDGLFFSLFAHDVTSRKQLKKSLMETLEVAEAASKAKSEFLANMSHEIRTPMDAVLGFTDLALTSSLSPKTMDYLAKIENASRSLMGIINDVLDFSKILSGGLELSPVKFDLHDLFDRLADLFSKQVADKELELAILAPEKFNEVLLGDVIRLEQVLINLIRNAIKFTERGDIVVACRPEKGEGGRYRLDFSIKDTGIGIPADALPHLFNPFIQLEPAVGKQVGGTGLGLSICSQLVTLMDGRIGVESRLGVGTTFTFSVMVEHHSANKRRVQSIPERFFGQKVLVVDDNPASGEQLARLLRSVCLDPVVFSSGPAAMKDMVGKSRAGEGYLFAMVDWRLSGEDGIRLVGETRAEVAATRPLRLPGMILLSPFGKEGVKVRGKQAGFDGFLEKPFTRSRLIRAITGVEHQVAETMERRSHVVLGLAEEIGEKIGGTRVLLAEDNEINRQVVLELLERIGMMVEVAADGHEATAMLKRYPFDLLLMDIRMPGLDGCEAARRIRSQSRFDKLPIIALTAHSQPEEIKKYLQAGMNAHLNKPVRPERLYGVLSQWVGPITVPPELPAALRGDAHLPDIPGLDTAAGLERVAGNVKLYRRILARFLAENESAGERIRAASAAGDLETVRWHVHIIRGLSGNIGATALHEAAGRLESTLDKGDPNARQAALRVFNNRLRVILEGLKGETPARTAEPPPVVTETVPVADADRRRLAVLLGALARRLGNNGIDVEEWLTGLKGILAATPALPLCLEMENHIENYDFPEALQVIERIAGSFAVTPSDQRLPHGKSDRKKILIVEDQRSNADILKQILIDYDRAVALNGTQALKVARSDTRPDLILLDILMPEMDGYEVIRRLKENERTRRIPVIFVTIKQSLFDESKGLELGAIDYIVKPFHPGTVRQRVHNHLILSQYREHLEKEVDTRTAELSRALRELQEKRAQLIHTGRLSAMGEMATGIAHELNQPLSSIRLWLQNLQFMSRGGDRVPNEKINEISLSVMGQVDRAATIINNMRAFAYGERHSPAKTIDVAPPTRSALSFFREQFRVHGITFSFDVPDGLPGVKIHANHFEQIVVNLLSNARYAVNKKARADKRFERRIELRLFQGSNPPAVVLTVRDNGIGMSETEKARCLEPFFTTKKMREGTGLGLYIIHGIITSADGKIQVESDPETGTVFRVDLPGAGTVGN